MCLKYCLEVSKTLQNQDRLFLDVPNETLLKVSENLIFHDFVRTFSCENVHLGSLIYLPSTSCFRISCFLVAKNVQINFVPSIQISNF